jgi:hypothetical protein
MTINHSNKPRTIADEIASYAIRHNWAGHDTTYVLELMQKIALSSFDAGKTVAADFVRNRGDNATADEILKLDPLETIEIKR